MKHQTVKEKEIESFEKMKSIFKYKNVMATPKMSKVVLNVGTGTLMKKDKNKNDAIADRLAKITGQKGALRGAKQSIASFKTRQGDPVGIVVSYARRPKSGKINQRGTATHKDFAWY